MCQIIQYGDLQNIYDVFIDVIALLHFKIFSVLNYITAVESRI